MLGWQPGERGQALTLGLPHGSWGWGPGQGLQRPGPPLTAARATGPGAPGTEKGALATSEGLLTPTPGCPLPRPPSHTVLPGMLTGPAPTFPRTSLQPRATVLTAVRSRTEHSQELPLNFSEFEIPVNSESHFCLIQQSTKSPPWLCGQVHTCTGLGTRDGTQKVSKVHAPRGWRSGRRPSSPAGKSRCAGSLLAQTPHCQVRPAKGLGKLRAPLCCQTSVSTRRLERRATRASGPRLRNLTEA